ncbi:MAG: molecular chaperone DjiA [Pseudomonadota bacterium]
MSIWTRLASLTRNAFLLDAAEPAMAGGGVLHIDDVPCAPDPGDVDFTSAIVALGAKLAKADGVVTDDEVRVFSRVFRAAPEDAPSIRRVFNLARQTVRGYESYAQRVGKRYRDRPCLLEGVLDGLFQIALADGVLTTDEHEYLESVAIAFGFSETDFRRIKASHLGPDADDPYSILGVAHGAPFEEIRTAYRRLMKEHHPDRTASAKRAPREYEPIAHEKAASITAAYAKIRVERGFLVRPD